MNHGLLLDLSSWIMSGTSSSSKHFSHLNGVDYRAQGLHERFNNFRQLSATLFGLVPNSWPWEIMYFRGIFHISK